MKTTTKKTSTNKQATLTQYKIAFIFAKEITHSPLKKIISTDIPKMEVDSRLKPLSPNAEDRSYKPWCFPSCHELGIPLSGEDNNCNINTTSDHFFDMYNKSSKAGSDHFIEVCKHSKNGSEYFYDTYNKSSSSGSDVYDVYRRPLPVPEVLQSAVDVPSLDLPVCLDGLCEDGRFIAGHRRLIHSPSLQLDAIRYGSPKGRLDPYSPLCMVPLPDHFGEPCFIRRRNERERERVRCVNEGYSRLKEHLPAEGNDRRMSKVETLRGAIDYIRQLQELLEKDDNNNNNNDKDSRSNNNKGNHSSNTVESHNARSQGTRLTKAKKRSHSLTSSGPDSPDSST